MSTDDEIMQLWRSLPKKLKQEEAILALYRHAESSGRQAGLLAMEKELLSDSTIEAALKTFFGLGRHKKASIITQRALLREAVRLAKEKVGRPE